MNYITLLAILFTLLIACNRKSISQNTTPVNSSTMCDTFYLDLNDGTLNGVAPTLSDADIREWMPCYSSFTPYGSDSNCNGAIFYKKYDFYYYTSRDFVEVRSAYKGRIYPPLLGKTNKEVLTLLDSLPVKNVNIDSSATNLFTTKYGCLQVDYSNGKVTSVSVHYNECEMLDNCR